MLLHNLYIFVYIYYTHVYDMWEDIKGKIHQLAILLIQMLQKVDRDQQVTSSIWENDSICWVNNWKTANIPLDSKVSIKILRLVYIQT